VAILREDPAVFDDERAIRMRCDSFAVGYQDERLPLAHKASKDLEDFPLRLCVEISGRLVREDERRTVDERPRDGYTLLFAAGELARQMLETMRQSHRIENLSGAFHVVVRLIIGVQQRQRNVPQG
jgi:hypothetical protein